jgi:hypothetical protein
MNHLLLWVGRVAGVGGVLLCALAVVVRISGHYWLGGLQVGTLLQAGMATMVAGCLSFLAVLTERSKAGH